jgi:DEAD/DEAH box helicase domain-containing protein
MNYLIYDCEIEKLIPPRNEQRMDGYEYCEGWRDFENMGISVIGCKWSGEKSPFACFSADEFRRIEAQRTVMLIGFNSWSFDDELLKANGYNTFTEYDVLEQVRLAAYGSDSYKDQPKGYSYSLGKIAEANGFAKTGSGELAPKLWQDGRRQEVIDYCLNDVVITEKILLLGLEGKLIDPNDGKLLKLADPDD